MTEARRGGRERNADANSLAKRRAGDVQAVGMIKPVRGLIVYAGAWFEPRAAGSASAPLHFSEQHRRLSIGVPGR